MTKKKIALIVGIFLFIGLLITISVWYYRGIGNQKELEEEALDVGIIRVNDDNFESEVLSLNQLVVLDFYENMCPPCASIIPTLIKIAKSSQQVKVAMINISDYDTNNLTQEYEVSATPTIVILKEGKVVGKFIGAASEDSIMEVVNRELDSIYEE